MSITITQQLFTPNYKAATTKARELFTSQITQAFLGFCLGLGMHKIYGPLTNRILSASVAPVDPFKAMHPIQKIVLAPFVCVIGPILEEKLFRGDLQGALKDKFESLYSNRYTSEKITNIAARATAIFFSSVIFGLSHFANALVFWCNPVLFLPQVVATTFMGFLFGLAKEVTGQLDLPIGMHIGNNTLACIANFR